MRHVILAAALAAALAAPAFAQMHGHMPAMNASQMQQMEQMHRQLRSQVLGYLTPAHTALLAQIAGQLATSPNPDYDAAASRLDAALSASEKSNIMNAANAVHARMRTMMKNMPNLPPGHPMIEGMHERMTAGGVLLMLTMGH